MKLPRRFARRGRVEIIPMIDTILILLIFYMSFSQFRVDEKRMAAHLDGGSGRAPPTGPLEIVLYVQDRDHIRVTEGVVLSAKDLALYMSQLAMVQQRGSVAIRANPETAYGDVIAALDACALARFERVGFVPVQQ